MICASSGCSSANSHLRARTGSDTTTTSKRRMNGTSAATALPSVPQSEFQPVNLTTVSQVGNLPADFLFLKQSRSATSTDLQPFHCPWVSSC